MRSEGILRKSADFVGSSVSVSVSALDLFSFFFFFQFSVIF